MMGENILIEVESFKKLFDESMDYAEMTLNKEIVDSEAMHYDESSAEQYKQDLILGYVISQDDLKNTIEDFTNNYGNLYANVDEIFEKLEEAFNKTDTKVVEYLEGQTEKGLKPLIVMFQDTGESLEVVRYGAIVFRGIVLNNITQVIIQKMLSTD